MDSRRIFILIKPDGVERGFIGEILGRVEAKGYKPENLRFMRAKEEVLRVYYTHLANKSFFPEVVQYVTCGPVVAAILGGANIIEGVRTLTGATDPTQAVPGPTRGDLAREWGHGNIENLIHTSDFDENAKKEVSLWFNQFERKPYMSDKSTGYSREVVVIDDDGLHVRPAAQFAQLVKTLGGSVFIDGVSVDLATKFVAAGFREGQEVIVFNLNPDKREAVDAIANRIAGGSANARWK